MQMWMGEDSFLTSNFDEPVLYAPARNKEHDPCSLLRIITAFTDTERISTHLIKLSEGIKAGEMVKGMRVEIILGMTKTSLSKKKHEDICRLLHFLNDSADMPNVSCRYITNGTEVHSKLYLWSNYLAAEDIYLPQTAYCGSLNYTMNAFYKRRESVSLCSPLEAYKYFKALYPDTVSCFDPDVSERLKNVTNAGKPTEDEGFDNSEEEYARYDQAAPQDTLRVSLLKADGSDTGYGSGVNWGLRPDGTKRNPNQAYIPYNAADRKPGFFPDREKADDKNCPMFKVITKDFGSFHMRMAQQNNKALQSVESYTWRVD